MLCGNSDWFPIYEKAKGKKIRAIKLDDNDLQITFEDGSGIAIFDNGQSCCETRYMRTDDNLDYYIGAEFRDMELRESPVVQEKYGEHEVQFLLVNTSKGTFTMSNHNEHNGYYGGFSIEVKELAV